MVVWMSLEHVFDITDPAGTHKPLTQASNPVFFFLFVSCATRTAHHTLPHLSSEMRKSEVISRHRVRGPVSPDVLWHARRLSVLTRWHSIYSMNGNVFSCRFEELSRWRVWADKAEESPPLSVATHLGESLRRHDQPWLSGLRWNGQRLCQRCQTTSSVMKHPLREQTLAPLVPFKNSLALILSQFYAPSFNTVCPTEN